MPVFWIVLIVLAGLLVCTAGLLMVGSWAIAYFATHPPRRRMKQTPASFGAEYEEVAFPARDGVMLSGWLVRATPPAGGTPRGVVILCHGMSSNRAEVLPWAETLWKAGFALLMFDFRALGQSEGALCTAGYQETLDLQGAVDYLSSREETRFLSFGVFGFSMGGATAILTAADDERLRAVATHGAFATLDRAIRQRCRRHFGPFGPLVRRITLRLGTSMRWFPASPSVVAPVRAVPRLAPRPLLILHGCRDRTVRPADARDLHEAAAGPKSLHILPRSGHRRIHPAHQPEALARVEQFFAAHL